MNSPSQPRMRRRPDQLLRIALAGFGEPSGFGSPVGLGGDILVPIRRPSAHHSPTRSCESIGYNTHAVESVACLIDPKAAKTLGPALKSLRDRGVLNHEALAQAFSALYGCSSNEQGIRHALLDRSEANVGLAEAMFMYGACASFAAYLVSKHRQINE